MIWSSAKDVLPHEAHHFTPWLSQNLGLLADVLGLDTLDLVGTEWKVGTFALDVLANGIDADGEVRVVIENQYGTTNHKHLGQLATYAAHAAAGGHRELAVWLTEEVHPAHLAAVEFLNRVAAGGSTFGIVLVKVRFAPGPNDSWHVYFEKEAEPNAFLNQPVPDTELSTGNPGSSATSVMASFGAKGKFIESVDAQLGPLIAPVSLTRKGSVRHRHGTVIYRLPPQIELASLATARVVAAGASTNVGLYIEDRDRAINWGVAETLRENYESLLDGYGLRVTSWHGSGATNKRDRVITTLPVGYTTGDAEKVASDAAVLLTGWVRMLTEHPTSDLEAAAVEAADAGDATDH
jgi:hypothetical protein